MLVSVIKMFPFAILLFVFIICCELVKLDWRLWENASWLLQISKKLFCNYFGFFTTSKTSWTIYNIINIFQQKPSHMCRFWSILLSSMVRSSWLLFVKNTLTLDWLLKITIITLRISFKVCNLIIGTSEIIWPHLQITF